MSQITELLRGYNFTNMKDTDKNGYTALHLTVINKKYTQKEMIEVLKILLEGGADPKIENEKNETVLQLAVKNRMKDVVDFLLTRIPIIDLAAHFFVNDEYQKFCEFSNQTKLDSEIRRVETESANFVEWLLSKGFDFDCKNERNQRALFMAIELNLQHILPVLLKCTKEINSVDRRNRTLLRFFLESKTNNYGINKNWYSKRYETEIVKIFLDRGVSVDTDDKSKRTPIEIAIKNEEDVNIVVMLLEHSTNINKKNRDCDTLFQIVVRKWINSSEGKKDYYLKIVQALVGKGADLNEPDKAGKRPVVYAIEKRNLPVIEFLRESGADFSITTEDGKPLIDLVFTSICLKTGDEVDMIIFELLLKHTMNIHHKNCEGDTLFQSLIWKWACSPDTEDDYYMKIARALINRGADFYEPNEYGTRPLFHAVERNNLGIVKLLEENGADYSMRTEDGETLIHWFVKGNNTKMTCFNHLISKGCQVHVRDKNGTTPLHVAAMYSNVQTVQMLIEHGARINCENKQKETPLHFATRNPKAEVVIELLLKRGANVCAKDWKGQTPLHRMAIEPRTENSYTGLQNLLVYGADVNVRDLENRTALNCARSRDHDDWQQKRQVWVDEHNKFLRRRAANAGYPPVFLTIAECRLQDMASDVVISLTKQSIKLKAANLPWDETINSWLGFFVEIDTTTKAFCEQYYEKCVNEVESLKSTFIDNRTSLYDLLRMDLNRKCRYVNNEKLIKLLQSPLKLKNHTFPEYADLIITSHHEAVTRKALLEEARKAWLKLTKISLPAVCIDLIFSFLSNSELLIILER